MHYMNNGSLKFRLVLLAILTIPAVLMYPCCPPAAAGGLEPDSLQDALLMKAVNLAFEDSFTAATACLDSLLIDDPEYWTAYVFKIGILYTEMTDDENYDRAEYFKAMIDTVEDRLDELLERNPNDKWANYLKGTAMGYWSLYEGHHGSWVKAVLKGLNAGQHYSKAIEIDSSFYEAYLGLGSLNYWRSAKMGILRMLPFIPDKREEGIRQIQLAIDSSKYSALPAAAGMAWVYYHRKDYNRAVRLMDELQAAGIKGRQVLWPKGLSQFKRGHARGTVETFGLIRDGLLLKGNQNFYNIGLCDYYTGLGHFWKGDYETALAFLNQMLDRQVEGDVSGRLEKNYKAAKEYKEKIKKAIAEKRKIIQEHGGG